MTIQKGIGDNMTDKVFKVATLGLLAVLTVFTYSNCKLLIQHKETIDSLYLDINNQNNDNVKLQADTISTTTDLYSADQILLQAILVDRQEIKYQQKEILSLRKVVICLEQHCS